MGNVQNARTAVEVLTQSPGPVRSARTAVEVLTQQRGKVVLARTAIEALTQTPKLASARTAVEVLTSAQWRELVWGIPLLSTPTMPAGLVVQLDATESVLLQSSGGAAAAASNDPVGVWRDMVSGRDAVQATAGAKPTLQKNVYNGQACIRFDGGDDQLILPSDASEMVANPTIIIVAKATSAGGRMLVAKSHTASGWSAPYHRWGWYNNGSFYSNWNGVGTNTTGWSSGDLKIIRLSDGKGYANKSLVTNGADADMTYPNGATPILISGNGVGSERWHGDICWIGIWNRSLSAPELDTAEGILGTRFGITLP